MESGWIWLGGSRACQALIMYNNFHVSSSRVVVVYHVAIVAFVHGLLEKFWPFGNRLRSTHCRAYR